MSTAANSWLARAWQSDDGLPDNSVSGLAQTPDGYLWVATAGGLMRFDGVRFQEFSLVSLKGVPNRVVRALALDRHGRLWLGMDRGPVVCVEPGSARVFTSGLPDARATAMAEDAQGAIWVAYADGGLARLKDGQAKLFGAADGLPLGAICSLACDAKGQLWFAKGQRLGVYREGRLVTLATLASPIGAITRRAKGGLWIRAGTGLLRFEEGAEPQEEFQLPEGSQGFESDALLEDHGGAIWLGTAASGLFRCEDFKVEAIPTSHRRVTCLWEDNEGDIWAGTVGGGLNRLRRRSVELLGTETGLPFESVRSVCEDREGAVWVTTQNNLLACWRSNLWTTVSRQSNWPGGQPSCVAADAAGGIWIGTYDRGLYHLQNGRFNSWRRQDGLSSDKVHSLLTSAGGDLWVATDPPKGIQRLRNGQLSTLEFSQRSRSIRALAEDAQANIWLGSAEGRLWRIDPGLNIEELDNPSPRLISIRCLHATADGSLWIGYAGWGIGRLKSGHLERITQEQGLSEDYVSQILSDDRGWLWCAGNRGIFQVRREDLVSVAEGRAERVRLQLHGRGEGLPNLQASHENFPGAARGRDGRLYFPMLTGLAVVHTEEIPHNAAPPPVLLERVTADGQNVALYDSRSPLRSPSAAGVVELGGHAGAKLRLGAGYRKVDFEYTALSFTAPENVQFQYRLDPVDDDWVEGGTQRNASYSRLPAGEYRFRVRACNNAGVWNEEGRTLEFAVAPFFWQSWPFRLAVVAVFTLSLVAVVRYVSFQRLHRQVRLLEQQAALHKERARIAKDIHDDLGANLTQIALLGELARQDGEAPEKADERLEKISSTARQAIRALDEIVWALNPRNDTLPHLLDYAGQFALDYLRLAGIRGRLDFPEQAPAREVPADMRHNLFLVIKEALTNVVKHAQATEVWLRAKADEQGVQFTVEDNGKGFDWAPENALADGLRNMRQRMAEIGGECHIASRPGAGTRLVFELPWARSRGESNICSMAPPAALTENDHAKGLHEHHSIDR